MPMSSSTKPRIVRKHFPNKVITRTTFRRAWSFLSLDFEERCAYSMQHTYRAGGQKCMEVDHFNPNKKPDPIQEYTNLFLSTRHCNGAKRDRWPTNKERQLGARFLNCCKEPDYGVHIFEDPDTHDLVGLTPEGRYHVRNCDLNAPHLTEERAERASLWNLVRAQIVRLRKGWTGWNLPPEADALRKVAETMIPEIPYLSGEALAKHRERRKALTELIGGRSGKT
jgi:hypothetical protein